MKYPSRRFKRPLQMQFELLLTIARMNYYEIIKTNSDLHLQHTLNGVIKEQEKVIFFGSVKQAENQLKTYFKNQHLVETTHNCCNLKYQGKLLFTNKFDQHFKLPNRKWRYYQV